MKAAVFQKDRNLVISDIEEPELTSGGVLVRIEYCGICGSDAHAYVHGPMHTVMQNRVMGHEFGGVVEATGEGVTKFKPGDKVTGMGIGGAFSERWVYHESILIPLPSGMTTREAAVAEPLAVALRGVKRSGAKIGERIAVLGAGPIGLMAIAVLSKRGFGNIIVSEPDSFRREMALKMGAAEALEPASFEARIRELTGFDGLNLVFECVGLKASMDTAMNLLGRGGRLLVLGALVEPYPLTVFNFFIKEISVIPSFAYEGELAEAINMIANREIDAMPIVTREIALDDIKEKGFEALTKKEPGLIKILVRCG